MRIAGGEFRGRVLKVPKSDKIRPTEERVREALFNIVQTEIAGADFLDLFAGSGAVGLEALSRGAASATFIEMERRHVAVLKENLATLGLNATVVVSDVWRYLARYSGPGFSMAFADPPYALGAEKGYREMLSLLAARGVVRPGGLFVAEMTAAQTADEAAGWTLARDRAYGRTRLCLWRREGEA